MMCALVCSKCQTTYPNNSLSWKCLCGHYLDIHFSAYFPVKKIKTRKPDLWRYREAIPIDHDSSIVSLQEGFTPLVNIQIGKIPVRVKLDYLFPTGSFKDRGSTVLISKMKELGINEIVEDSSGNAGASVATYSSLAGIKAEVFVPATASGMKLNQIGSTSATLRKVQGERAQATQAALVAAENSYYASHVYNPYFLQGTKTIAYEICEQLGWKCPDALIVPAGNGTLLLGAYIGFKDLLSAGIIEKIPVIIAVQAANCNPLATMFNNNTADFPDVIYLPTIAEGIAVAQPARFQQIIGAVRNTDGFFISVTEEEVVQAARELYSKGFFIEPSSAAVAAAIKKEPDKISRFKILVTSFTGSGLKASV